MIVRRVFGRVGRVRESASFGAAALGVLLLAGAALGSGVARTAVDVSDGLTWLADDPRGEVIQVNPSSGRPETRLQVSGGDAQLEITQKDGVLVILDRRTGQITVIDLATLLASGRRQAAPGEAAKVLVSNGRIYIVDRAAGTVRNADPVTLADVGEAWEAGQGLADVVVDDAGVVWAVDNGGHLHALEWSDDGNRFDRRSDRQVPGAGPRTVLVPHPKGVTLLGLDSGVVVQEGTGQDVSAATPQFPGEVLAARTSPAGLVPAAVPGAGTVVIVAGDRVLRVDVKGMGCATPGRPVVFRDSVYVPCRGAGKVIVLDRSGERGGPDVGTPGTGDPELVFDDGRLFINTPGAERGVIVDSDGSTRPVTIRSPELPVVNPDRPPIPEVPAPPPPSPRPPDPPRNPRNTQVPPASPGPGQPSTGPSSPGPTTPRIDGLGVPSAPPGLTIMLAGRTTTDVTVSISWNAAADNGDKIVGYSVVATGAFTGGNRGTQTTGTSTQLTFPCGGGTFCNGGKLDVSVTATNGLGTGPASARSWNVPPPSQTTTTNQPPPTTTNPPPTTTNPPPPPPATVPAAGATVITGVTALDDYSRRLVLSPPSDWANHDGPCELVNTTEGHALGIACSATSVDVFVAVGTNRFLVRAHARDNSRSVDSAPRSVFVRDPEPRCGQYRCLSGNRLVELSPTRGDEPIGPAGAGLGLLAMAVLLRVGGPRREKR